MRSVAPGFGDQRSVSAVSILWAGAGNLAPARLGAAPRIVGAKSGPGEKDLRLATWGRQDTEERLGRPGIWGDWVSESVQRGRCRRAGWALSTVGSGRWRCGAGGGEAGGGVGCTGGRGGESLSTIHLPP